MDLSKIGCADLLLRNVAEARRRDFGMAGRLIHILSVLEIVGPFNTRLAKNKIFRKKKIQSKNIRSAHTHGLLTFRKDQHRDIGMLFSTFLHRLHFALADAEVIHCRIMATLVAYVRSFRCNRYLRGNLSLRSLINCRIISRFSSSIYNAKMNSFFCPWCLLGTA
jgi:hypothetical protein